MRELSINEIDEVFGSGNEDGKIIGVISGTVVGVAASEFATGFVIGAGYGSTLGPIGMIGVGVLAGLTGLATSYIWDNC